jgi:perosamine synthetase
MNLRIPLSSPDITEAEIEAVAAVMRTNSLSLGPKLEEFEDALATYHKMPHAIAVSSGTAALHLAIRALDIGEGDEVIVPSFTFIAVANAVCFERATPIFVDIDPITLNMDPKCVEAAITPRTQAMIIVHTFGVPAEMDALMSIARRHNLAVIEDACEAIGANLQRSTCRQLWRRSRLRLLSQQANHYRRRRRSPDPRRAVGRSHTRPAQSGPLSLRRLAPARRDWL